MAVYSLASGRPVRSPVRCMVAGLGIALGFAFKAVALFYLAAVFGYLFFSVERFSFSDRLRNILWVALGFGLGIAIPAAYFAAAGQLRHQTEWTILFPLLHYSANTFWLRKLYTKLLRSQHAESA